MQDSNELYHYGRMGMRWGQHKYHDKYGGVNKAGQAKVRQLASEHRKLATITVPTNAGIKRQEEVRKQYEQITGKSIDTHVILARPVPKTKPLYDMTNEELSAYNTRKDLEKKYQDYQPKQQASKGKAFVNVAMNKVIIPASIDIGKKYATQLGMKALKIQATDKKK